MKKLKFKPEIEGVPFNTNNAWGFGGRMGTAWTFPDGLKYQHGVVCFRHAGTQTFGRFLNTDNRDVPFAEGLKAVAEYLA